MWVLQQPTPAICLSSHSSSVSIYLARVIPPFCMTSFLTRFSCLDLSLALLFCFMSKIQFRIPSTPVCPPFRLPTKRPTFMKNGVNVIPSQAIQVLHVSIPYRWKQRLWPMHPLKSKQYLHHLVCCCKMTVTDPCKS